MSKFIAISTVYLPSDAQAEFSGRYTSEGDPIMKKPENIVRFGDEIELTDDVLIAKLLRQKAICLAKDFDNSPPDNPRHFPKPMTSGTSWITGG